MKETLLGLVIVSVIVTSFTADARGHRGGGGHRSYIHSSGNLYHSSTPVTKKKSSVARRSAKYATVGAVGYGAYQAHNYTTSYVREKARQDAKKSTQNNYQSQYQPQPQQTSQNTAPTCSPVSMASQPGYTNLPICQGDLK